MSTERLVTEDEAAELVGVKPATIRSWIHRGHLAPVAGRLFVDREVYECERARRRPNTRLLDERQGTATT